MDELCSCLPRVLSLSRIEHAARELLTLLGAFAKLRKATTIFVMSVRPHGTTLFPLGGFSCNLNSCVLRISVKKIQTIKI